MGFYGLFTRRLSDLVTCIVEREGESWSVTWASDGRVPNAFSAPSLSAACDRASSLITALYSGKSQASKAELQFAIYPWSGNPGAIILDVTTDGAAFTARDIQGTGITVQGESLEVLVQKAETMVPNPGEAMFRWIRKVSSLQSSGGGAGI